MPRPDCTVEQFEQMTGTRGGLQIEGDKTRTNINWGPSFGTSDSSAPCGATQFPLPQSGDVPVGQKSWQCRNCNRRFAATTKPKGPAH